MPSPQPSLRQLLDSAAERINSPAFIPADPVQFPRRFADPRDAEIAALLCATIAWGNRKMICRDCGRLLTLLHDEPYRFVADGRDSELDPDSNIHRTFFGRHLQAWLRALRPIYRRHGSLQGFARSLAIQQSDTPAWTLAEGLARALADANAGTPAAAELSRCMPMQLRTTALKRINMALRWLVRNDGIVDLGIWDVITPAQLFIPLDVHSGRTARALGLLTRRADDRQAAVELTRALRRLDPADPVRYDFALFGLGIESAPLP